MKNMLNFALEYAARGWFIFPCREKDGLLWQDEKGKLHLPKAKSPYIKQGLLNASKDPAQIRAWWGKFPSAAIGCNCGMSGLFAFDLDVKDGRDGHGNFLALEIDTAGTLMTMTPSGGLHIIYTGSGKSSSNSVTGVDTRGQGGYIILPPSEIFQKGVYEAIGNWSIVPAALDPEVIKRLFPENMPARTSKDYPVLSPSEQVTRVQKALDALDPARAATYSEWIRVGMALADLGNDGLSLWHRFSARCPEKYNPAELDAKWETFRAGSGLTIGTVFYYASQDNPAWFKRA